MSEYDAFDFESPIGFLRIVGSAAGIHAIAFRDQAEAPGGPVPVTLRPCVQQLEEYFTGRRRLFTVRLAPRGTPFQMRVWQALRDIPYGQTRAYYELAQAIGNPRAVRAVGAANGRNPIPILIPCHRVIGRDGSLVGFGGGLWRKAFLLRLEQALLL